MHLVRVKFLVKWFKQNPHLIPDPILHDLLMPAGEAPSPILEALGGPSWLEGREHTDKTDHRLVMQCRSCMKREPMGKLFVSSKCKKNYYWCVFEPLTEGRRLNAGQLS